MKVHSSHRERFDCGYLYKTRILIILTRVFFSYGFLHPSLSLECLNIYKLICNKNKSLFY